MLVLGDFVFCRPAGKDWMLTSIPEPQSINLEDGTVAITWKDGHRSSYLMRSLRLSCPCAHCVDEWSGTPLLDNESVPLEIEAVDSMNVGNYGVQFLWSDAHFTGIYTYKFLRDICSCANCGGSECSTKVK